MEIYLDNSATTKVCPEAVRAVTDCLTENYGNPSAVHSKGIKAKMLLDASRQKIADALSCDSSEVYFSHSGTLANNTAIFGAVEAKRKTGNRIITTSLEHPSVSRCMDKLEKCGFEVIRLAPSANGSFRTEQLVNTVNKNTILISTMLVNNETGAINPVELISKVVKRASAPALIHIDAIQAFGKIPVKPVRMGVDLLSISGHKVHAPKGVGALYIRKGIKIKPFLSGGGQENDMFSGTEALPAIAGFGAAASALPDLNRQLEQTRNLKNFALNELSKIPAVEINSPSDALPYILNISVTGIPSQVLINYLSQKGIYISAGSACKKGHRSEVLTAMGLPAKRIDSAVRVSMSRFTTQEEIAVFCEGVNDAVKNIRTKL
ncbi:MAG: cysteine desulfurase [Clostridia bacterium]|nr:cysteine desulfurase [Clostridia bacterium]MBQ3160890.1 cysteine desulfurase [Oscillospiraceae bacterium]